MRPVADTRGAVAEAAKADWVFSPEPAPRRPVAETRGAVAEPAKAAWVFPPDPPVEDLIPRARANHGPLFPEDTRRIRAFLSLLGDPHLNLPPVFHVAGTNGKGSTL